MAEELGIRSIWNKGKEQEDPRSLHMNMLEKRGTKTTLYWIKIILWMEFWITVVGVPLMIWYFILYPLPTGYLIGYTAITLIYLFYYQFLIKQINGFSYDGNVVHSLKKVYGYLRFYLLHYKVVIWFSLIAGFIYGLMNPEDPEALGKIQSTRDWIVVIAVSWVFLGILGGLLHLIIHLIYGRKIKRLRIMVKDLEREE